MPRSSRGPFRPSEPAAPDQEPEPMADLKSMKNVSAQDQKLIADAEALLGPEPSSMGFVKNLFWGNLREDLVFPYPQVDADENARCEKILRDLDEYMSREHPSIQIDQEDRKSVV